MRPRTRTLDSILAHLKSALPAAGLPAIPQELTEPELAELFEQGRALVATLPADRQLGAKTALFEARHSFYLAVMRDLPEADRHIKPFDRNNSGTLELREVEFAMRDSFGKSARGAWSFSRLLFWGKMGHWNSVAISKVREAAGHASGSGNWLEDGTLDEARFEDNSTFLASHPTPFASSALAALVERNTVRSANTPWMKRVFGRRASIREHSLTWQMAGVKCRPNQFEINASIYRMNAHGTLIAMLFNPRQEAATIFGWKRDGVLRHS